MLETKKSRLILERQSIAYCYIPSHKIKSNFLDYYSDFVHENARNSSMHLISSFNHFKTFLGKDYISASNISENLCENFRTFLLKKFNGSYSSMRTHNIQLTTNS